MSGTAHFEFRTVGIVRSPFRDKFAVPRQPGLAPAAEARLYLHGECNREDVIRGLADFSHLWITFVFHQVLHRGWKPTVRPPRLGGNRRLGVFATRSPFRPNPVGLSAVELKGIEERERQWCLILGGVDMVDGTPVLDIKPYVPYVDAIFFPQGPRADGKLPGPLSPAGTADSTGDRPAAPAGLSRPGQRAALRHGTLRPGYPLAQRRRGLCRRDDSEGRKPGVTH